MTWTKLATYALGGALVVCSYTIPALLTGAGHDVLFGAGMGLLGLATQHPLAPRA